MNDIEKQVYDEIRGYLSNRGNWNEIERTIDYGLFLLRRKETGGHPLTDLCAAATFLFMKRMKELGLANQYQAYSITFEPHEYKTYGNNHHFIRNKQTGEVIDLTAGQYGNTPIPYKRGFRCHILRYYKAPGIPKLQTLTCYGNHISDANFAAACLKQERLMGAF